MNNYQNIIQRIKNIEKYVGIEDSGNGQGSLIDKIENLLNKNDNSYTVSGNSCNTYVMNLIKNEKLYAINVKDIPNELYDNNFITIKNEKFKIISGYQTLDGTSTPFATCTNLSFATTTTMGSNGGGVDHTYSYAQIFAMVKPKDSIFFRNAIIEDNNSDYNFGEYLRNFNINMSRESLLREDNRIIAIGNNQYDYCCFTCDNINNIIIDPKSTSPSFKSISLYKVTGYSIKKSNIINHDNNFDAAYPTVSLLKTITR